MTDLDKNTVLQKVRRRESLEHANLSGLDLAQAVLEGARLRHADLRGTNLERSKLRGSRMGYVSGKEAFFAGADLREVDLEAADLEGANLKGANLRGANLSRANLEGADLTGANLEGAQLQYAQLDLAKFGGADLRGAIFSSASASEAYFGGTQAARADMRRMELGGANFEEADFTEASFEGARLCGANFRRARLIGASLHKADATSAILDEADLSNCDARNASLQGASLSRATLTGLRVAGMIGTGAPVTDAKVGWIDASREGDGSERLTNGQIPMLLGNSVRATAAVSREASVSSRHIGHGDTVTGATLTFADNSEVRIDGILEGCTIKLGHGAELVVGTTGVLSNCTILGGGRVVVHGAFFEQVSPGIVAPGELVVSSEGILAATISQGLTPTRFAFERGSRLRMQIQSVRKAPR